MSEDLQFAWRVNGVVVAATSVVLSNPTGTFGVKRTDTNAVVVPAGTAMVLGTDSVYRYPVPAGLDGVPLTWVARVVYNGVTYHYEFDSVGQQSADIGLPVFEHVTILVDAGKADLRIATVEGLSTKHGNTLSDRGRLHATIDKSGDYRVRVFADMARTRLVMQGTTATLGQSFTLDAVSGSGMAGYALLAAYSQQTTAVLIPTFAIDADVMVQPEAAAALPGYNSTYGLAFVQAQQHRALLLSEVPAALPHLYADGALAGFASESPNALPLLTKIANADTLRVAQAMLVKAAAAEQNEHIEEWAAIAAAARKRFDAQMTKLKAANPTASEREAETADVGNTITASSWTRG